jgi:hypothetical protein
MIFLSFLFFFWGRECSGDQTQALAYGRQALSLIFYLFIYLFFFFETESCFCSLCWFQTLHSACTSQVLYTGMYHHASVQHTTFFVYTFAVGLSPFFFSLCVVVGGVWFELRASYLLGRYFTIWGMPPILFALVILEIGSHFLSNSKPFFPGWSGTEILISASHVAWDDRHVPLCPAAGWDGIS